VINTMSATIVTPTGEGDEAEHRAQHTRDLGWAIGGPE
jgi:hypothetical protein